MSSRFVSGGTDEQPLQRDEAWLKAQQELDAAALARQDAGKQEGGKSLIFLTPAAKQEAFEEASRLTNQFRSLDEDEIEFLDSVQEGQRAREAAVKKDTQEGLDEFRRRREEAEKAEREAEQAGGNAAEELRGGEDWGVGKGRKRRKGREGFAGLVKVRRVGSESKKDEEVGEDRRRDADTDGEKKEEGESAATTSATAAPTKKQTEEQPPEEKKPTPTTSTSPYPPAPATATTTAPGLGLGAYSSDEDDDD